MGSNERNKAPHPKSYGQIAKTRVVRSRSSYLADPNNPTSMEVIIYGNIKLTREAVVTWDGEAAM